MSVQQDPRPATIADLLALPEDQRVELIAGELVPKVAPSFEHSATQASIGGQLFSSFARPGGREPPGGWWIGTEAEVVYDHLHVFLHDLAGWRRERVPTRPSGRPIEIRPDWVCEVLSPSNVSNDTVKKFDVLQRHGVPWYWLVDPTGGWIHAHELRDGAYVVVATAERGQKKQLPPFDAVEYDISVLLGDDPQSTPR